LIYLDAMPLYTQEVLNNMTVKSKDKETITLASICEKYNIKKGI